MKELSTNLLTDCAEACKNVRANLLEAARMLYQIREQDLWKGEYDSFTDYVEQGCQLNRTQMSRLLTVYEHYVVKGGVDVSQLSPVNPERLYLAARSGGLLNHQLMKAKTLTVAELRKEQQDADGHICEPVTIQVCKHCGARVYTE